VGAVKRFHDKQGLNFTLLADEDHAVTERYGVWVEKSRYGKTSWGAERTTFLLDEDGRVTRVLRRVKPDEHDRLVLDALGAAA
jgi:thioredoxin-dependent peroxiredoxin